MVNGPFVFFKECTAVLYQPQCSLKVERFIRPAFIVHLKSLVQIIYRFQELDSVIKVRYYNVNSSPHCICCVDNIVKFDVDSAGLTKAALSNKAVHAIFITAASNIFDILRIAGSLKMMSRPLFLT